MKKVISLFKRDYEGTRLVFDELVPGAEWVTNGEGIATIKIDGTSCLVRDGKLYKRYDAKNGKTPPVGFEPAQDNTLHCVTCLCVVQYPKGDNYAAQKQRRQESVPKQLLQETSSRRPNLSGETEQEQKHSRPDLRTMPEALQGQERQEILQGQLRGEVAMGEWNKAGQDTRTRETQTNKDREGLRYDLQARASQSGQERVYTGTPSSDGESSGALSGGVGTRPSSERDKGRQQKRELRGSNSYTPSWIDYLSTLPEAFLSTLKCPDCGGQLTKYIVPDPVTGHWPGWLLIGDKPEDKYHREAFNGFLGDNGTYELIGPKVQGNPYNLNNHILVKHGEWLFDDQPPRSFDALKLWFEHHNVEGIVWHRGNGDMVKIKRRDFGLPWPIKTAAQQGNASDATIEAPVNNSAPA